MPGLSDYLLDAMRSMGSGAVTGFSQAAGLPGDLAQGMGKAFDYFDPNHPPAQPYYNIMPTSHALENSLRDYTGPAYQPQTALGSGAQAVGELVPAMMGSNAAAKFGNRIVAAGVDQTPAILANLLSSLYSVRAAQPIAQRMSTDIGKENINKLMQAILYGGGTQPAY